MDHYKQFMIGILFVSASFLQFSYGNPVKFHPLNGKTFSGGIVGGTLEEFYRGLLSKTQHQLAHGGPSPPPIRYKAPATLEELKKNPVMLDSMTTLLKAYRDRGHASQSDLEALNNPHILAALKKLGIDLGPKEQPPPENPPVVYNPPPEVKVVENAAPENNAPNTENGFDGGDTTQIPQAQDSSQTKTTLTVEKKPVTSEADHFKALLKDLEESVLDEMGPDATIIYLVLACTIPLPTVLGFITLYSWYQKRKRERDVEAGELEKANVQQNTTQQADLQQADIQQVVVEQEKLEQA